MKKISYILSIAAMGILCSCGLTDKASDLLNDDEKVVDGVTPDRIMADVKGPVKSIQVGQCQVQIDPATGKSVDFSMDIDWKEIPVTKFDPQGNFSGLIYEMINDKMLYWDDFKEPGVHVVDRHSVERDEKGHIVNVTDTAFTVTHPAIRSLGGDSSPIVNSVSYVWDGDQLVKEINKSGWEGKYMYVTDQKIRVPENNCSYSNVEVDSLGNWISYIKYDPTYKTNTKVIRKIEYYGTDGK